jgi:hypothetical protein
LCGLGVVLLDGLAGRSADLTKPADAEAFVKASSGSRRRAQIATSTPSRAKAKAIALPIPTLAPVTSAALPFIFGSPGSAQ